MFDNLKLEKSTFKLSEFWGRLQTYLKVKYNYDNKYDRIEYLPLYDFSHVRGESYQSEIRISNSRTLFELPDLTNKKQLVTYINLGFNNGAEDSLINKIESAFAHLKKFYEVPSNSELPNAIFNSDLNKPLLIDTKDWILLKLNTYTAQKFDVHNSYSSYKVSNPSFSFEELNLLIRYYDITNELSP